MSTETIKTVEKLVSELWAISRWDTEYQQHHCTKWYETVAFGSRQRKHCEKFAAAHLALGWRGKKLGYFMQSAKGKRKLYWQPIL
jgi:hypothetical protein